MQRIGFQETPGCLFRSMRALVKDAEVDILKAPAPSHPDGLQIFEQSRILHSGTPLMPQACLVRRSDVSEMPR